MKKLAIITTHPIQYYAPIFKLLNDRNKIQIKVFYTWSQSKNKLFDKDFGKEIKWDIPLLNGYNYTFVNNTSKNDGVHHFFGIKTPQLIKHIKDWQADFILVFGWNFHSHLKVIRHFKGKTPVLFRGDSTLLDETKNIKTLIRRVWLKWVYKHVDTAFYVGKNNKKYYKKHGFKEGNLIFTPHAIDNNRFYDKSNTFKEKAEKWKNKLGFSKNDLVVLFVGKFETKKNPLLIINIAKRFPKLKFFFVGNGILEEQMKHKAVSNIFFIPFQNQSIMPIVYRLGNIFVLPSQGPGETWGLAVNEAMACGLPILVSDKVGCAIDLVKNNENGYIFKSNGIDDLSKKLDLITNNIKAFGINSKTIIQNWNFNKIAEAIESHIKNRPVQLENTK